MTYEEFLAAKVVRATPSGFAPGNLSPGLFGWQAEVVRRACEAGRYAIFADCGMGKTAMQLEWSRQVCLRTGGAALILAPLAVAPQTVREGAKFGVEVRHVREMPDDPRGVYVTNYERMGAMDVQAFDGVVFDESSILKSFAGKVKRRIVEACAPVRYRLSCTATPSPNDLMELLNQAEFLGVMRSSEALSVWFVNDQSEAGAYRLKGHAEADFWAWVASWCTAMSRPSDLGWPDDGFELPPLREVDDVVDCDDGAGDGEATLFHVPQLSATSFHKERRRSLEARCRRAAEIANGADGQCLVWCYLNEEADRLRELIPGAAEVRGSDSPESKERAATAFQDGELRVLISKPSIFGFGLNFQRCREVVFCGLDYSFESYYQAVRRCWRFGQAGTVTVRRVIGSQEARILDAQGRKAAMHDDVRDSISRAVARAGSHFSLGEAGRFATVPFLVTREVA